MTKANEQDPKTPEEWQEAVNTAYAFMCLHSARQYSLVIGGPEVNAARCEELIERGKQKGIEPQKAKAIADMLGLKLVKKGGAE